MGKYLSRMDTYFGISESGSTLSKEIIGGFTTFATMSYIIFVQPTVLSAAGMPFGSVLMATCFSACFASVLMGILARYPVALAPGMGENFLFAFTVCGPLTLGGMGFSWRAGLAIVLISGVLFVLISLFAIRTKLMTVLPNCLKNAIGPAIGMFIAFIGLQWGGILAPSPATMVRLGNLHRAAPLITLLGVTVIAVFMARGIPGGILLGILLTYATGLITGVLRHEALSQVSMRAWFISLLLAVGLFVLSYALFAQRTKHPKKVALGVSCLFWAASFSLWTPFRLVGLPANLSFDTFFSLQFAELASKWDKTIIAIALFFFLDLFDTVGTLVGVASHAGLLTSDGKLPRAGRAFFADAAGTCVGALFGTSTVTSYIESVSGVAAGARTGLAAVIAGGCFLLAIFLSPVVEVVGKDYGPVFYNVDASAPHVAMYPAVAPALIVVGLLMMRALKNVNWDDITEALPAFFTLAIMVFGYGITEGIAMGCISFAVVKTVSGRWREVHPLMYVVAGLLLLRYALLV